MNDLENEITDEYDKEFIALIMEIERLSQELSRHDQLRIKSWCKKLCQITNNTEWKKNRNLHSICLLDNILNKRFEDPYNKFAPEGSVPIINKTLVKSRLSPAFLKHSINFSKAMNNMQGVDNENDDNPENPKQINDKNNINLINIDNINDINTLKNLINQIRNDNNNKNKTIKNLQNENMKLNKKIQELEKMLSNFVDIDNNTNK